LAWYKLHYDVNKLKFDDMVMMILAWYNTHYVWIVIVMTSYVDVILFSYYNI